jgi:hypothetical protein
MAIREILKKIVKGNREEGEEFGDKDNRSADEVELEWFKKKEYLARVKRELKGYREKQKNEIWKGRPMGDKHQIIKAPNAFKNQKKIFTKNVRKTKKKRKGVRKR